tara:strand:- start:2754 stop:3134 length:381 start_codon:yes stop_codon:yes gene_type:complete
MKGADAAKGATRSYTSPWHRTAAWINDCFADGFAPETIAILVRSEAESKRTLKATGAAAEVGVNIALMHEAKGKEYRAVAVIACDADVIPNENRLLAAGDEGARREVYDTERYLRYGAATRARERL